jgi:iron complex transport system substrate-binding protein
LRLLNSVQPMLCITKPIQLLMGFLFFVCSAAGFCQAPVAAKQDIPTRIASLNICIDQLLWELVPRERLVSISYLTADPLWSPIAQEVRGIPLNHGAAEELIPLEPDVIFAGEFDAPDAIGLLEKLGNRVERLTMPRKLDEITTQIVQLADKVGAQQKAEAMVEKIEGEIAQLRVRGNESSGNAPAPTAFWYTANGVVIGDGTLEHELMTLAGLRNLAAEQGMYGFNQLDLEFLLSAKPQILIVETGSDAAFSLAREYLSHPALRHADFKIINLPTGLSGCAASVIGNIAVTLKHELAK